MDNSNKNHTKLNIAIIPARGGSKRFPGKNIVDFCGKPLIAHSIMYALKNRDIIDRVIVSTDSIEIEKVALEYGAEVIRRPKVLSGDNTPTVDVVTHVAEQLNDAFENVFLLQPTNPLRPSDMLVKAYEKYKSGNHKSLFTISRSLRKFGKLKEGSFKPENYKFGQRSQDMEQLYYENGLLYISHIDIIRENKLFDEKAIPFEISHVFGEVDIDTKEDLYYAEFLNRKLNE